MALPDKLKPRKQIQIPSGVVMVDQSTIFERKYSPKEAAKILGCSSRHARDLFRTEPGVVDLSIGSPTAKRTYASIKIPESVLLRVYARRQQG